VATVRAVAELEFLFIFFEGLACLGGGGGGGGHAVGAVGGTVVCNDSVVGAL
jgi:hypothetical protein